MYADDHGIVRIIIRASFDGRCALFWKLGKDSVFIMVKAQYQILNFGSIQLPASFSPHGLADWPDVKLFAGAKKKCIFVFSKTIFAET